MVGLTKKIVDTRENVDFMSLLAKEIFSSILMWTVALFLSPMVACWVGIFWVDTSLTTSQTGKYGIIFTCRNNELQFRP